MILWDCETGISVEYGLHERKLLGFGRLINGLTSITKKEIYNLIADLSKIDYGEPLPTVDDFFLKVWTDHYHRIISLMPEYRRTGAALEIGIGYGVIAVLLRRYYKCSVTAIEHPSRAYLHRGEFKGFIEREGIRIIPHDLNDPMPFNDETFDVIFYCDVMEHLPPSMLKDSFEKIRRVSKRNGLLILTTPNLARLPNRLRVLMGRGINPPPNPRQIGETYDHIREYTLDEIEDFLEGGFHIIKYDFGLIPYFNRKFNRLNSVLSRVSPRLGDELYILAEVLKAR